MNLKSGGRAVFLDRDGVLNRAVVRNGKPYPPRSLNDVEILPDASDMCRLLRTAGFLLIGVTNQPDVARGTTSQADVDKINDRVRQVLGLDGIRTCFHDDRDNCSCRKPKPGLLVQAAKDWSCDLSLSFMIGDRDKDIQAGKAAGCRTIFIDYQYDEPMTTPSDFTTVSLIEAAQWILKSSARL